MDMALKNGLVIGFVGLSVAVFFFSASCVYAQMFDESLNTSLELQPSLPSPHSSVLVTLNAYAMNTTGASISWYINNIEVVENRNERSITVPTGSIGEDTVVKVEVKLVNGIGFTLTKIIRPTVIDLIFEADTSVPVFYKGRALPAEGSAVRVIAQTFDGSGRSSSQYTYKWELNRQTLFGGPIKGRHAAEITMPRYDGALLAVEVTAPDGTLIGKKTLRINTVSPELYFYEVNPLRGLARRPIVNTLTLLGEEVTVRAEPYYFSVSPGAEALHYEWRLDGLLIDNANNDPYTITLRSEGGSGRAAVNFTAVNTNELSQNIESQFTVLFE